MKRFFCILIFLIALSPSVYAQSQALKDMTATTAPAATDILYVVINPTGSAANRKLTIDNLFLSRTGNKNITAYASLSAAQTAIGSSTLAIVEIPATTTVSASLTIPSNITLKPTGPGMISVSAGQTLTINGNLDAPLRQVFTGAGSVAFGTRISVAYPEWFGAVGDGSTNDTTAIDNTQLALSPGSILYLSPRTYLATSGFTLKRSGVLWKSSDGFAATIKRTTGHLFVDSSSFPVENVAFEGITFTTDNSANFPFNLSGHVRSPRWSRCRFWKFGQPAGVGYAIVATGTPNAVIEDSLFHNPGNGAGIGISFQSGGNNLQVRRNRFLYCATALVVSDSTSRMEGIVFENNYVDAAFPYLVTTSSDSGSDVSYSSTVLTDSDASFSGLTAGSQIRVLPVRVNGSGSGITYTRTTLTDTDAPFTAVREGDIIRSGSSFAIVAAKRSNSILDLEEWLSDTDRQAVAAPANDTAYTIYRLILGNIVSNTGTTITVERWYDIDGTGVTPDAETLYEILYTRPSHAIQIEAGCRNVTISKNTIKRSGADQIIATASEQTIEGNYISHGFDMGVTLWNSRNKIKGNTIVHQGVGGIWTNGTDNLIEGNQIVDSRWINSSTSPLGADITVQVGSRNRIQNNFCNRLTTVHAYFGILIAGDGGTSDNNIVQDNTSINHVTDDITVFASQSGDTVSNTIVAGNRATTISQISGPSATVTGSRFWNNKATTLNLSTGFFTGTYSNAQLRDNEFTTIAVGGGTTVTGTDWNQVKVTNTQDGANSEYFEAVYSANVAYLRSTATGTGTARPVKLDSPDFAVQIGGFDKWGVFGGNGMWYPAVTNSLDIGSPSFQVLNTHSRNWVSGGVAHASLGTPSNGTFTFCTDCQVTSGSDNTCTSGGTGAFAARLNGAWRCFAVQN